MSEESHKPIGLTTTDLPRIAQEGGIDLGSIDLDELLAGMIVEQEHGSKSPDLDVTKDDSVATMKIAVAHLKELPDYYTKLRAMESEGVLKDVVGLIESKKVTVSDFNRLIKESLPKSAEERVARYTRPKKRFHIPSPGKKVSDATDRKGDADPTKTFRGRRAVRERGEANKEHPGRFAEAVEFVRAWRDKPIIECQAALASVKDKPALDMLVTALLRDGQVNRDWLYDIKRVL